PPSPTPPALHSFPTRRSSDLKPDFRYRDWAAISGRLRTVPYNPTRIDAAQIPDDIMAFADGDFSIGWAPSYGAFRSFITAMRLLDRKSTRLNSSHVSISYAVF